MHAALAPAAPAVFTSITLAYVLLESCGEYFLFGLGSLLWFVGFGLKRDAIVNVFSAINLNVVCRRCVVCRSCYIDKSATFYGERV